MKRILTLAAASAAGLALATQAEGSATQHCRHTFDQHMIKRAINAEYAGARDIVRQDSRDVARFIRCARPTVSRPAMRRYQLQAADAWATRRSYASPVVADVPGVPWGFAACVAWRESSSYGTVARTATTYGIIPASGYNVEGAPLSTQKVAFHALYRDHGIWPWHDYDRCG